ncbi:peptidoglycan recognition protein 3 [Fopius arisanus]|uniref:Peptidoglycan recognition protein 3 n=1 Tax=Fopius arisanus TaxID=64838 RepID=A0A9R1TFM0_9HYME|nr:PREDICTED: peptidoglycan recognition protein 3-like [Fopius arisanus]
MLTQNLDHFSMNITNRKDWGANETNDTRPFKVNPPEIVIIHNTGSWSCNSTKNCRKTLVDMQKLRTEGESFEYDYKFIEKLGIPVNFVIATVAAPHTYNFGEVSLGITFMAKVSYTNQFQTVFDEHLLV